MIEFPESADAQREQFVERQDAKSADCDVFYSDVIWTAEFAQQKWLYDMTPLRREPQGRVHPVHVRDDHLPGQELGRPAQDQRGLPLLPHRPGRRGAEDLAGGLRHRGQGGRLRLPGRVLRGADGQLPRARVRGRRQRAVGGRDEGHGRLPENLKALKFMVDGIKSGAAPKATTTYMEEPARRAFESGRASVMRNWPYCYALGPAGRRDEGQVRRSPRCRSSSAARPASSAAPTSSSRRTRRTRAPRSSSSTT